MTSNSRLLALIPRCDIHPASRQSRGSLDSESSQPSEGEQFEWPTALLIHQNASGVFLERLSKFGEPLGDTWHATVTDALAQAEDEFAVRSDNWCSVPVELTAQELVAFLAGPLSGESQD